MKPAKIKS